MADQFNNLSNVRAHEMGTGREIWEQTEGGVTRFCAMVGTGGTFMGCARALKKRNPDIQTFAIEPEEAAALAGREVTNTRHKIQGAGYAMVPPLWEPEYCDGFLSVSDEEAIEGSRRLARREGIFVGFSARRERGGGAPAGRRVPGGGDRSDYGERLRPQVPEHGFVPVSLRRDPRNCDSRCRADRPLAEW